MRAARTLSILALLFATARSLAAPAPVFSLTVTGVIGPAAAEYVQRGLAHAARDNAQLVVLTLDTPGGLDTSMRRIVQDILASPVPVAAYVAPSGARAASAGTFILYACHVAAMAPGTNLGAASPVAIGMAPAAEPADTDAKKMAPTDVHERKAMQDAAAYIRSLAQLRGRNAEWGEKAVTEAASLSATEALQQKVVELVATNEQDLLRQLDARKVSTAGGERVLQLAGAATVPFEPDWHFRALAVITDPSVAMILMLLGIYGLIFEFGHPGYVFPGVIGAVSLLLGLYALHLLPVNYAGLALIAVGIAFMVAEVFVPAYGSLGIGGIVAFVVGAVMLIDTDVPGFGIPGALIAMLALVTAAFVLIVAGMAVRARRAPIVSGLANAGGRRRRDARRCGRNRLGQHPRRNVAGPHIRAACSRSKDTRRCGRRPAAARRAIRGSIDMTAFGPLVLIFLLVIVAFSSLKVLREYQRGVVFQLGRFWKVKGPGLVVLVPGIQQMVRVELRTVVLDVPSQDVISRDNVSVKVNAVVYFRVVDPQKAIIEVENFLMATSQLAQTTLRSVLGKHDLDEMLSQREKLNIDIQQTLDVQTLSWGIKVANVEIKHVDINETMIRAIARQAEAERERRAKVIHAEGEMQAAQKLFEAAQVLAQAPLAIQLRYLETLTVIAADKNSTIVFPLPMDIIAPLLKALPTRAGE